MFNTTSRQSILKIAATAAVFLGLSCSSSEAILVAPVAPVVVHHGVGAAAGPAIGIIGVVSALVFYDIIRRTTCAGDFLGFGGPGFSAPMKVGDNAMPPPKCPQK